MPKHFPHDRVFPNLGFLLQFPLRFRNMTSPIWAKWPVIRITGQKNRLRCQCLTSGFKYLSGYILSADHSSLTEIKQKRDALLFLLPSASHCLVCVSVCSGYFGFAHEEKPTREWKQHKSIVLIASLPLPSQASSSDIYQHFTKENTQ